MSDNIYNPIISNANKPDPALFPAGYEKWFLGVPAELSGFLNQPLALLYSDGENWRSVITNNIIPNT